MRAFFFAVALLLLLPMGVAQSSSRARPLQIETKTLPQTQAGIPYKFQLKASGGVLPYRWAVLSKPLPANLQLDPRTGIISGTPRTSTPFSVLVQVRDSSQPPLTYSKSLSAARQAALAVQWTAQPRVAGANLAGAVRVRNGSKDEFDLTVIVVAVNQFGKAFALRYEHLSLAPDSDTPDLAFQSSLPLGNYTVHVDAVAEVPAKKAIYRDRLQQEGIAIQSQ
jgi:hypothetical protein